MSVVIKGRKHPEMHFKTRLVTYDQPDSEGDIFRRPVRWDDLEKLVGFDFQPVAGGNVAGKILKVHGHSQGVDAVLEFKRPPVHLVPVVAFKVQRLQEEDVPRIIERARLVMVSMVAREEAVLPADFFFEEEPEPAPWIEVRKVKP